VTPPEPPATDRAAPAPNRGRRVLIGLGALVGVVLLVLLASATVPRWWAQRIGDQADGSMTAGSGLGVFYGFVFTALPLLVLWWTFRRRRGRRAWAAGAAVAVVLALPNLMTLSIVLGTGGASHAGERILDVEGPGFRGGTLLGALLAAGAVASLAYLTTGRRRADRRARRLEDELRAERAAREGDGAGG
jgi:MFS family permease